MTCKLCDKKAAIKGFCKTHYNHYNRKQIDLEGNLLKRPVCKVLYCDNEHTAENGFCWPHYKQKLKGVKFPLKTDEPVQRLEKTGELKRGSLKPRPLTGAVFNALVIEVAKLYYKADELFKTVSKDDPFIENLVHLKVGLAFIKSPVFILRNMGSLSNTTIRALINNEEDRLALKGFIDEARKG